MPDPKWCFLLLLWHTIGHCSSRCWFIVQYVKLMTVVCVAWCLTWCSAMFTIFYSILLFHRILIARYRWYLAFQMTLTATFLQWITAFGIDVFCWPWSINFRFQLGFLLRTSFHRSSLYVTQKDSIGDVLAVLY